MEILFIEKTKSTPEIYFDPNQNKLKIKGQSYPENSFKFYEPVLFWLDEYLAQVEQAVLVEIDFTCPTLTPAVPNV